MSGACSRQGVIKITYPYPKYGKQKRCFKFDLHFSSPIGWNFNIGDSTNDGYGGDAGQTSNAAEVHNKGDSFYVYSNILDGYESYADSRYLLVEKTAGVVKAQRSCERNHAHTISDRNRMHLSLMLPASFSAAACMD